MKTYVIWKNILFSFIIYRIFRNSNKRKFLLRMRHSAEPNIKHVAQSFLMHVLSILDWSPNRIGSVVADSTHHIWLRGMKCNGTETSIDECHLPNWGSPGLLECAASVRVLCYEESKFCSQTIAFINTCYVFWIAIYPSALDDEFDRFA